MQIIPGNANAVPSRGPRSRAYDMAQQAAIEKKKSIYIELTCDHFTTWEEDELYSAWRPTPNAHFCEKCGKWRNRKVPEKRAPLPDNPMF